MSRYVSTGAGVDAVLPADFLDEYAAHITALYQAASFRLTAAAGLDDYTATLAPALDGAGLVAGMQFSWLVPNTNTGDVTLAINGGAAIPVIDALGLQIAPGQLGAGLLARVEFDGDDFRLVSPVGIGGETARGLWVYEASGTWARPDWLADTRAVLLGGWAGGGGGDTSAGGGGGGYGERLVPASVFGATTTITVAGNAAAGVNGGNTSIGSHLVVFGGQAGSSVGLSVVGGRGAGTSQSGADGGYLGGGAGASAGESSVAAGSASQPNAGGGGGAGSDSGARNGGNSVRGGAGGASTGGAAGQALGPGGFLGLGGNGGGPGSAGAPRGGGAGSGAAGGRGEAFLVVL